MELFLISIGDKDEELLLSNAPEDISVRLAKFADYLNQKDIQIASITCAGYPLTINVASYFTEEFSQQYIVDHRFANYQSKVAFGYSQQVISNPNCQNIFPLASDPRNESKDYFEFRIRDALTDVTPKGLYILPSTIAQYFSQQMHFNMTSEEGIWHILYKDDPASINLFEIKFPCLKESFIPPQSSLHEKISNLLQEAVGGALDSLKNADQEFKASTSSLYDQVRTTSKTINQLQSLFSHERSDEGDEGEGDGNAAIGAINRDLDIISSMIEEMNKGLGEVIEPEYIEIPEKVEIGNKKPTGGPKELEIVSVKPEEGSVYAITIKSHSSKVEKDVDLYFESNSYPQLLLRRIPTIRPHTTIEVKVLIPLNTLLSTCTFWFGAKIENEDCCENYAYGIFKINVVQKGADQYRIDVINNTSMALTADLYYGQRPDQKRSITIKSRSTDEVVIRNAEVGNEEKKFIMKYGNLEASNKFP